MSATTGPRTYRTHCGPAMSWTVHALHWDGYPTTATVIIDWMLANGGTARYHDDPSALSINVPGGTAMAVPGDWIVYREGKGFHPCTEDVFARVYEPIGDAA